MADMRRLITISRYTVSHIITLLEVFILCITLL